MSIEVECVKGTTRQSLLHSWENLLLVILSYINLNAGRREVFRWKGDSLEAKDLSDITLGYKGSIEEKYLGFGKIYGSVWIIHEIVQKLFNDIRFPHKGVAHEEHIINKFMMEMGEFGSMQEETIYFPIVHRNLMICLNPSTIRIKMKGERGSSW